MSKFSIIQESLDFAQSNGILIHPGAVFDWTDQQGWPRDLHLEEMPVACNWIGAILIKLGYTRTNKLPWSAADKLLNVGTYWIYRFHMGFDRGRQLQTKVKKGNKEIWVDESVSREAIKIARKYIK